MLGDVLEGVLDNYFHLFLRKEIIGKEILRRALPLVIELEIARRS